MTIVNLLDVVALTVDIPEYSLTKGQVGTVVKILASGQAFEVEFSDSRSERLCQRIWAISRGLECSVCINSDDDS